MLDATRPLFREIVQLHGRWHAGRAALVDRDGQVDWAEFAAAVRRVANGLCAQGIVGGDRVGIVMTNSRVTVEVIFGVLSAGAVAVPINVSVSDDAICSMLNDAGVRAIFITCDQIERIGRILGGISTLLPNATICSGLNAEAPAWTCYEHWLTAQSDLDSQVSISDDDPCNIIYSSGTTGAPKGIVHTQRGRLDWAYDLALALQYHSGSRTLVTLGLYSNISWVMMLCTMLMGGTLVVLPKFDVDAVFAAIDRYRITNFAMVPLQFERLLAHPALSSVNFSSMRAIMSCGSPLAPNTKAALLRHFPCAVIELYGLTEGVITTLNPEEAGGRLESVGKPIQGTDIRLVAEDEREVAEGEAGEIVSRSRFVMPGYWNRPQASAEVTWTDSQGRRWLRTGDIGRIDKDGFLYIVDRKKDMILSGGQNVYPADIEAVLRSHVTVADCAVVGVPHKEWGETPLAIVVPNGQPPDAKELKEWLNSRLGKQQRVSAVVFRQELPRNHNGKVLKRELRKLYG